MSGPFQMSSALRRTFTIFSSEAKVVLAIVGIAYLPVILGALLLIVWLLQEPAQAFNIRTYFSAGLSFAGFFVRLLAIGASIDAVFHTMRGEEARVGSSLRVALRRLFPLLGLALVVALAVGVGTMLCLVPGIILQSCLYVAIPALVVERIGVGDAWQRSFDLTSGYRWEVFGVLFVLGGLSIVLGLIVQLVTLGTISDLERATVYFMPLSLTVNAVVAALSAVASVVVYHDLRLTKEGLDEEDLLAVFA